MKLRLLIQLFVSFFRIGLLSFGGGYTVIPLLQNEAVEKRKWISSEELIDSMAIAQTFPGAIIVNASTMVGYRVCGFLGALVATTSTLIPNFVLILVLSSYFWRITDNIWVKKAFAGIIIGITALIIYSITKVWKSSVNNIFDIVLVILSSTALIVFKINVILVILGIAGLGFFYNLILLKKAGWK